MNLFENVLVSLNSAVIQHFSLHKCRSWISLISGILYHNSFQHRKPKTKALCSVHIVSCNAIIVIVAIGYPCPSHFEKLIPFLITSCFLFVGLDNCSKSKLNSKQLKRSRLQNRTRRNWISCWHLQIIFVEIGHD